MVPIFDDGHKSENEQKNICGFGHINMTKALNIDKNSNLYRFYRITLDIDNSNKEYIKNIISKVKKCKNLIFIRVTNSNSKGYHFLLYCKVECDICRIVFDDSKRFLYDNYRKKCFQNILFDKKEVLK